MRERTINARKVHIVCGGGLVAGKEVVSLLLARGLRDVGWTPEFIASHWNNREFLRRLDLYDFARHILPLGFISATLRFEPIRCTLDQLIHWPKLACGFTRIMAESAPLAVIHTNWQHSLLLIPFLDCHRDIFWLHEVLPNTPRYGRVFRAIAKRVGRIVCVSHAVARNVAVLGVPESQVVVIHSGVSPIEPTSAPGEQVALRLGIVGQVAPWKGHDDLLDALALLLREGVRVSLRIFGAGALGYVDSLKRRITELNLQDQVEWCGFMNNQSDIFGSINVCVVPSRVEEALGMTALEASAFGRPVICSDRGGLPEVVMNGVTGIVVETQRPDQLAEAIKCFAHHPDVIKTMGEAARKRIQSEFSLARFVGQFIEVVEELNV